MKSTRKAQRGSIAIEAAIVFPVFVMIFVLFAVFFRLSVATVNLKHITLANADNFAAQSESIADFVLLKRNAKKQWIAGESGLKVTGPMRSLGKVTVTGNVTIQNTVPFLKWKPFVLKQTSTSLDWKSDAAQDETDQESVWSLPPMERGNVIQAHFGRNLPKFFPTICKFDTGVAVSMISLDVTSKSYLTTGALEEEIREASQALADFSGGEDAGVSVTGTQIKQKELWIVIPGGSVTAAQENEIAGAIAAAKARGIGVRLIEYQTKEMVN
ncbi:MAG: hypothetical protein WCL54_08135 [Clostridia bacterium]